MSDRLTGRLAKRPWRGGDPLPEVGSTCLVSGVNCDVESDQHRAYTWMRVVGYAGEGEYKFVCLQKERCWPTVERLENCWFAEIPTPQRLEAAAPQSAIDKLQRAYDLTVTGRPWVDIESAHTLILEVATELRASEATERRNVDCKSCGFSHPAGARCQ